MATTTTLEEPPNPIAKKRRVCFSFAAYAKTVIEHLRACHVPVEDPLSADEFSAVESNFRFTFPPDLRSILQEGLPVGPGFPNWRSASPQQLQILTTLPILGLSKQVSTHKFWDQSWGPKPKSADEAVKTAQEFLTRAPVLVPIYRQFYIPSAPNLAGNPVFYVHGGDVELSSFDVAGFFQRIDFGARHGGKRRAILPSLLQTPAWAAMEARRIEFWTDLAARGGTRGWWSGDLVGCMEEACCRLRDGGWREEEVREMTMMDGGDGSARTMVRDRESVAWHLRVLSRRLLRAGWSTEDVVDSLGFHCESGVPDMESWLDFQHTKSCLLEAI
ncbi:Deoxyribodipyrimidine photo-lyase [Actinidia chinensis var. chinensis]|uniref:Deoxyribodipyrimidine photo-lyase n=1 Tax=Actinidia chinensis var. chinensis TaxID=1590841 RepID=A0A2R6RKV1_ACTCC|nr:Deoxyribodipyrimidine photo-lyase [Actinidia chinensis var. chinensis]